ncbi:MAG TPA: hypothetical protein VLA03_01135, partial [Draconibacterium sp.]|nr:hypothetical protein [Draconibacterium sp.]
FKMKLTNPIPSLLVVLLVFVLSSCDDGTTEVTTNLRIIPKQVLSANIGLRGELHFIPQMLMAEGGSPSGTYSWEIDTSSSAPEELRIGPINGIVTWKGTSAEGFKIGTTYFKVNVSDGDNTVHGMVGLRITDYKVDPVSDVQQLQVTDYQLMNGSLSQPYCASLFVMGGTPPYSFSMDSTHVSELKTYGLKLDPVYGLISGTIPKTAVPRVLSFRVDIRDSKGKYALYNPIYKIRVR